MISDKLSVGPSQLPGEIDVLNVHNKGVFNVKKATDKKDFENVLKKTDNEFRATSGGTNRKMLDRKIDKNPKRLSEKTEKDEKELKPTSNPMAFQQSRVEVVDSDKNPASEVVLDSEVSEIPADQKLNTKDLLAATAKEASDDALLAQVAESSAEAMNSASGDVSVLTEATPESAMNPFQANVFQALQQAQQDAKVLNSEVMAETKDLSEAASDSDLNVSAGAEKANANLFSNPNAIAPAVQGNADQAAQQFAQQFENSFAMKSAANPNDSKAESTDEFKLDDKSADSLTAKLNQDGVPSHLGASHQPNLFQSSAPTMALGVDQSKQSAPMNQNTSEIVKQAEFLVKDGGGTAKIKMTPEGLGTVDLRVTMNDGKVQLELHTADPQAKKLLQDSITDLRSSLASHNFNLDHVKINNMSAMADLSQQNSNSQSFLNQQQHSSQQQNWNQFEGQMQQQSGRQGNQSQDSDARANFFKPDQFIQSESRQQTYAAPKINRGYAVAAKSTSSMNMVA